MVGENKKNNSMNLRDGMSRKELDRATTRDGSRPGISLRPKAASTLIILDGKKNNPKVLMGRRHRKHKFMPGLYVFPGGRVEKTDGGIRAHDELNARVAKKIQANLGAKATNRKTRALGLACMRETYEETGVILGETTQSSPKRQTVVASTLYDNHPVIPTLSPLRLVARAITPPGRPRRFDTWFFATWSSHIKKQLRYKPSDELEKVQWITINDALKLELPLITQTILEELSERLNVDPDLSPNKKIPFFHLHHNKFVREMI